MNVYLIKTTSRDFIIATKGDSERAERMCKNILRKCLEKLVITHSKKNKKINKTVSGAIKSITLIGEYVPTNK